MDIPEDALDQMLLMVMHMIFEIWGDDGAYHVGMALGQITHGRRESEDQEYQQTGEWRSYNVDGYRFSIRQNDKGILEIQRQEI